MHVAEGHVAADNHATNALRHMTNPYDTLARDHGRRCVMSLNVTDEELDAETARQTPIVAGIIKPLLHGDEKRVTDFGCGSGRFMPMLADLMPDAWITGVDPCIELLRQAPIAPGFNALYCTKFPPKPQDVVFIAMVLGTPGLDLFRLAREISGAMAHGGLLVLLDHMPAEPPGERWWQFRMPAFYSGLFGSVHVPLHVAGHLTQLDNPVTVMAGRKQ
jgi:SAM-dependent methyltransferase